MGWPGFSTENSGYQYDERQWVGGLVEVRFPCPEHNSETVRNILMTFGRIIEWGKVGEL